LRGILGLILLLVGGGIMLTGGTFAVLPLVDLYRANLEHPLDQPESAERNTSDRMLRGVYIGAAGTPLFIAGSVLLKITLVQRLRKKK